MKSLPNMKICPEHGMYPARFDSCPTCNPDAKSEPLRLSGEQTKAAIAHSIGRGDLDESQRKEG